MTRKLSTASAGTVITALSLISLSACTMPSTTSDGESAAAAGNDDGTVTVAFVPKVINSWYDDVEIGAKKAIAESTDTKLEYTWFAPQKADVAEWTTQVQNAIQSAPDVLAISCLDPDAGVTLIDQAVSAGIKVINFDTPCNENKAISFVGHKDTTEDGYAMGTLMAEKLGGKGEVAILAGSPGALNHKQRVDGFKKAIAEHPDMTIVDEQFDNDSLQDALTLSTSMMQSHPDITGIFAADATAPIGAGRAVQEAGKTGKVIVTGMDDLPDAIELLKSGNIAGLSVQHVQDIGYFTMTIGKDAVAGKDVPAEKETGSLTVTSENVDSYK